MENIFDPNLFLNKEYTISNFSSSNVSVSLYSLVSTTSDYDLTGQIIWPAATLLSEYLIDNQELIKDKSILELGAGAGLTGFVASKFANFVCITDGNDIVVELLNKNKEFLGNKNISVEKLEWGVEKKNPDVEKIYFDVIIGADILFWPASIWPLVETLDEMKRKNEKLKIIIALCKRSISVEKTFDEYLKKLNFERKIIKERGNEFIYEIIKLSDVKN